MIWIGMGTSRRGKCSHEAGDDAVESAALVSGTLSRHAQLLEILSRLWRDVVLEFHHDAAEFRGVPVSAELEVEVDHGVVAVDLERGLVVDGLVDNLEDVLGLGCCSSHRSCQLDLRVVRSDRCGADDTSDDPAYRSRRDFPERLVSGTHAPRGTRVPPTSGDQGSTDSQRRRLDMGINNLWCVPQP